MKRFDIYSKGDKSFEIMGFTKHVVYLRNLTNGARFTENRNIFNQKYKDKHKSTKQPRVEKKKVNHRSKSIDQLTMDGEFIRNFDSVIQAANELEVCDSSIYCVLNGSRSSCKGFKFRYVK